MLRVKRQSAADAPEPGLAHADLDVETGIAALHIGDTALLIRMHQTVAIKLRRSGGFFTGWATAFGRFLDTAEPP